MRNFLKKLKRGLNTVDQYADTVGDAADTLTNVINRLDDVKANHLTTNQRLDLMDRRLEVVEHFMNQMKKQLEEQS